MDRPAMAPPPLLSAEHIAMIDRGISVIVASHDQALRPSLMRAVGCRIRPDGGELTVFLARQQSRQLLQDVAATGALAVVCSEPSSHRTVQLKSRQVRVRPAGPDDVPVLQRYLASMEHELCQIGHDRTLAQAMLAYRLDDLVALSFAPEQAFDQTPGPLAGQPLPSQGGAP